MKKIKKSKWEKLKALNLGGYFMNEQYWLSRNLIPIGTRKPYESYPLDDRGHAIIPEEEIITLKFDPIEVRGSSRKAMNILILGGSGDGKSLFLKLIWYFLQKAGWYCGYFDPKSSDSGRARWKWEDSTRLPPYVKPEGIKLVHYCPVWSVREIPHIAHHFRQYSTRLSKITEKEMWQGLGMRNIGASKTTKIIQHYLNNKDDISIKDLQDEIFNLPKEEMPQGSMDSCMRVITDLEDFKVVDDSIPEIDLEGLWRQGYSVCMSYNSSSKEFINFDIGQKIKESRNIALRGSKVPIMWFEDDASYYADEDKLIRYNFAVETIKNIGFNWRSLGLNNALAVQSLKAINEQVAESYNIKIITPSFSNPDSLSQINIPKWVIQVLNDNEHGLMMDKTKHLIQYFMIDENRQVKAFFPFTPPCNHFRDTYPAKEGV